MIHRKTNAFGIAHTNLQIAFSRKLSRFTHTSNFEEKKKRTHNARKETRLIPPRKRTFLPEKEEGDISANKTVALYIKRRTRAWKAKPERIHVRLYLLSSKRRARRARPRTSNDFTTTVNYSVRCTVCPSAVFIKREPESAAGELILAPCLSLPRAC